MTKKKEAHLSVTMPYRCGGSLSLATDEPQQMPLSFPKVGLLELTAVLVVLRFMKPVYIELFYVGCSKWVGRG